MTQPLLNHMQPACSPTWEPMKSVCLFTKAYMVHAPSNQRKRSSKCQLQNILIYIVYLRISRHPRSLLGRFPNVHARILALSFKAPSFCPLNLFVLHPVKNDVYYPFFQGTVIRGYGVDLMTTIAIILLQLQSGQYMWDKEMEFLEIETKSPKLTST